jgi:hypothetical protein
MDRGKSWTTNPGLANPGNVVLHNGEYFSGVWRGVMKRKAAGETGSWTQAGLAEDRVQTLSQLGPYLFALTYSNGIYRSRDGGGVWDPLPVGSPESFRNEMFATNGALIAGFSSHGVYRSLDSGTSWKATAGIPAFSEARAFAATPTAVFALASLLYRSVDRGGTWTPLDVDSRNGEPLCLATTGADLYLGTTAGWVLRSSDNGGTWNRVQVTLSGWRIEAMAIVGTDVFAATSSEVFRSSDRGNTWTLLDLKGTRPTHFASMGGDLFAACNGAGVYRSRDDGANWVAVNREFPFGPKVSGMASLGGYVFTAISYIHRSGDRGVTWQQLKSGIPQPSLFSSISAIGPALAASCDGGLFQSQDSGLTWTKSADANVRGTWPGPMVRMGRHILLGTHSRPGKSAVHLSVDEGMTWSPPDSGMPPLQARTLIAKDGFFFAGVTTEGSRGIESIGMYRSADSGATWVRINNGLTEPNVSSLVAVPGALIAGTRIGAFRSSDNGDTWAPIDGGTIPPILSLTVSGDYLVAGTESGGIWRMNLSQVASAQGLYRPRQGAAAKAQGLGQGNPYDVRGREASAIRSRIWKIRRK